MVMTKVRKGQLFDRHHLLGKQRLRIEEAAFLLDVTTRTVQRYLENGKLTAAKTPGGHRRVKTDEVKGYL